MRRVTTAHIALAIAATIYAVQARAFEVAPFEPVELPEPFALEAPCLPADCVADVVAQYQMCITWPLVDGGIEAVEEASRCALRMSIRLDCCAGIATPGVICP